MQEKEQSFALGGELKVTGRQARSCLYGSVGLSPLCTLSRDTYELTDVSAHFPLQPIPLL